MLALRDDRSLDSKKHQFKCRVCGVGYKHSRALCQWCNARSSIVANVGERAESFGLMETDITIQPTSLATDVEQEIEIERLSTGSVEFDRVLGCTQLADNTSEWGAVYGCVYLLSGPPGVGKSTVLTQCVKAASPIDEVIYGAAEELPNNVRARAKRFGLDSKSKHWKNLHVLGTASAREIANFCYSRRPSLVIFDSVSTMFDDQAKGAPGGVVQMNAVGHIAVDVARKTGAVVFLVVHVNKDGDVAGPKALEHLGDCTLEFNREGAGMLRVLRAKKNRYGDESQVGFFEMTSTGLKDVPDPSERMLRERPIGAPGCLVAALLPASSQRATLVEVQALVAPTALGTPRRSVVGWDPARLSMVLAVLEAHGGLKLGQYDVYLNIAGGLRVTEPAADLAAAAALVSSLSGALLPRTAVYFGEIGLSGSVRPVVHANARMKEAAKLGFSSAVAPLAKRGDGEIAPLEVAGCEHISKLIADIAAAGAQTRRVAEVRR